MATAIELAQWDEIRLLRNELDQTIQQVGDLEERVRNLEAFLNDLYQREVIDEKLAVPF